jgi:hypothetical protein
MGTFVIGNIGNDRKGTINFKGWISSDLFSPWQYKNKFLLLIWLNENVPFFLCQQCVPEPASQVPLSVVSDISDDINSPEIQGKWGPLRQRGSVPSIFNGGTMAVYPPFLMVVQ